MIRFLILAVACVLVTAQPADAGPLVAAITAVSTWFTGLGIVAQGVIRLVVGLVIDNAMQRAAKRKMRRAETGIRTSVTMTGGTNPDGMVMGFYATAGSLAAPYVEHGQNNIYNSHVIDLSGVPVGGLVRVFVNGSPVTLGGSDETIEGQNFGRPAQGQYAGHLWIKFYDGTQTAADPMLVARGAADPDFPWSAEMVGIGRAYAICTVKFNQEVWQGVPQFRFELSGARFYDMRKDGSIGGSGAHRLNNPATWEATNNPMVAVAHLSLGYALPSGEIYGGGYSVADLPLADWAAAMNACDAAVAAQNGGNEPAWRAGLEIGFDQEPLEVIEALLQVCDGEIVDLGGRLFPKVGAPGLPVAFITDADLIADQPEELDPFPGLNETVNALSLSYPDPAAAWESVEAPRILSPDLEAADGGRRLEQSLSLPACPYPGQVQRLGQALIRDARRFARHVVSMPGDLAFVRPLQTISWTSARNGYTSKLFEVTEQGVDLFSYQSRRAMREVDPSDYDPQAYLAGSVTSSVVTPPPPLVLAGAGAVAWTVNDSVGPRRPAIRAFWEPLSADGVEVEVYRGAELVAQMLVPSTAGQTIIAAGILPATTYVVRLRIAPSGLSTAWAGAFTVVTSDVRVSPGDLVDSLQNEIATAFAQTTGPLADATGTIGQLVTQITGHFGNPLLTFPAQPLVVRVAGAEGDISSLTGRATTLESQVQTPTTGLLSRVSTIEGAYTTDTQALAFIEQQISASYGSLTALAQATSFAEASVDGITAGYVLRLNGQNVLEFVSVSDGVGGPSLTNALIAADYVRITGLTQIDQAVIEDLAVSNAFINNLTVNTLQIANAAVTQSGVAGSGPVTNNSSDWTTVAQFTLSNLAAAGFLQGTVLFRLTAGQNNVNNYPTNAEWRVTVDGVVATLIPRGRLQNPDDPWLFTPFSRLSVGPGNVTVVFEMRNQGGFGVNNSNLYAQVAMR
jgi:hypothetical protein